VFYFWHYNCKGTKTDMKKMKIIRNKKGVTLTELVVVMAIIGILAVIGVPQYQLYAAKSGVRRAANDLLQNARLARTLAIKESRPYVIAFNVPAANSYSIGFDTNGDGLPEGYENTAVRVVNLQTAYGNSIVFGTTANTGPDEPDACGNCIAIGGSTVAFGLIGPTVFQQFNPDGSVGFTGSAFITHNINGFTYMLRTSYQSGNIDLWAWDGDIANPAPPQPVSCANPPIRYCGWTEVR
jgi:prepilin-type N-terminal cleavage/methylation domain-containing protein